MNKTIAEIESMVVEDFLYKGRPLSSLTKEELLDAVVEIAKIYERDKLIWDKSIKMIGELREASKP